MVSVPSDSRDDNGVKIARKRQRAVLDPSLCTTTTTSLKPQTPSSSPSSMPTEMNMPDESFYTWRVNVGKTSKFWRQWFEGFDRTFLTLPCQNKLIILNDQSSLDTALSIGHMQGKIQFTVIPAGHCIHENEPGKFVSTLIPFTRRVVLFQQQAKKVNDLNIKWETSHAISV